jgi:hypothetical protein
VKSKVTFIGLSALVTNLQVIATSVKYQVENQAIKMGLETENRAKGMCPVVTGRLRASTSTNWTGSGKSRARVGAKAKANDGVGQPSGKDFQVFVGKNVIYAESVHRRTPYLLAAFNEVRKLYLEKIEAAMARGLKTKL